VLGAWRNPLVPPPTSEHLNAIRMQEIGSVIRLIEHRGRLLEIGAGTGWQSRALAEHGFDVTAIDVATSIYSERRVWPVVDYDGFSIPFPQASFDVVYSSSTLEHIPHLREFQRELHRVLKPGGLAVHVVPSATWRFWTSLTHLLRYLTFPVVHGEHSSSVISEMFTFRRTAWARLFGETGWRVLRHQRGGLFYTGCCIADHRLSIMQRENMSRWLGSSVHIFVLSAGTDENEVPDCADRQ
jgi:2-polyprenyl-3-methyl-5-hydroxy-6-metoxy-1,4-benzoquinol methylase